METESLNQTIKKAIEHFDEQNWNYKYLAHVQNVKFDESDSSITFIKDNNEKEYYNYELLGYFDNPNGVWIWGWVLADFNYRDTPQCKYLLDYGLKLEPKSATLEQAMIKGTLVNSRIKIEEFVQLEINLALYSYLVKDRIKFIYGRKKYLDDKTDKYVTFYYFIK
jgi:hypothetical protein